MAMDNGKHWYTKEDAFISINNKMLADMTAAAFANEEKDGTEYVVVWVSANP
jgi:hypothetical protein